MKHRLNRDRDELLIDNPGVSGVCRPTLATRVYPGSSGKERFFYRIGAGYCRMRADLYRIIAGFYRLWAVFYRVFPPFPASSRIKFFGAGKVEENHGDTEAQSQAEIGTSMGSGVQEFWSIGESGVGKGNGSALHSKFWRPWRIYAGKSADCYGLLRESSRKFAQIRPVNPRLFGFLRVGAFLAEATHYWKEFPTESAAMGWCDAA